ncbi:PP2C family protein-serine/threonine phosphatase [Nocardioides gilvus]|uniref:PP2C family protein-serine/threonine phosphatase n=1 Tax=Nocardioides gilvus TaxID=1735589 RepID=UPI000D74EFB4|nr:protein phosphatase 2C domain-containing protein [Nocardioides gilvus]
MSAHPTLDSPQSAASLPLSFGAASHPGTVRRVNEDGWYAEPPVFLVADGMGGHRAGDVASAIVVESFEAMVRRGSVDAAAVEACIGQCQERIQALVTDESPAAPGSTLVAAVYLLEEGVGYWLLANVGDSRAYVWQQDQLEQLSHDHSVVQELIDAGELDPVDVPTHPERHVITRALGAVQNSPADYSLVPATAGSRVLLCSDGVTTELDDATLARLLADKRSDHETASTIVAAAVEAGGKDNATAVVVTVRGAGHTDENTLGTAHPSAPVTDTEPDRRGRS